MCDGGAAEYGAALGHPKVYLNMGSKDAIACNYCGQTFELDPNASAPAH
ncbi:MAG: zinc-finger domain-containing protein [Alphaproteobacteria bacterium]